MNRPGLAFWRWLFWLCVVGGVVLALWPASDHQAPWFPHADKAQHAVSFAVLFGLGCMGRLRPGWRLATGLLTLGAAIEVMQSFTATRSAEWADLLADAVGIAAGAVAVHYLGHRSGSLPEKDRR